MPDGSHLADPEVFSELEVPQGCLGGGCGTCLVTIKDGKENLNLPSKDEELMDKDPDKSLNLEEDERLLCQCRIESGRVVIEVESDRK